LFRDNALPSAPSPDTMKRNAFTSSFQLPKVKKPKEDSLQTSLPPSLTPPECSLSQPPMTSSPPALVKSLPPQTSVPRPQIPLPSLPPTEIPSPADLWESYLPSIQDYKGNIQAVKTLQSLLQQKTLKPIILSGKTGSGKTSLLKAILRAYDIFEDTINDDPIEESFQALTKQSLIQSRPVAVIIETIEGVDLKLLNQKIKARKSAKLNSFNVYPFLFLTCDDIDDYTISQLKPLKQACHVVYLEPLSPKDIAELITDTCKRRNHPIEKSALINILQNSNGNPRYALNMAQFSSKTSKRDDFADMFSHCARLCSGKHGELTTSDMDLSLSTLHAHYLDNLKSGHISKVSDLFSVCDITRQDYNEVAPYMMQEGLRNASKPREYVPRFFFPSFYESKRKATLASLEFSTLSILDKLEMQEITRKKVSKDSQ